MLYQDFNFIDTHCHLDLYKNPDKVILRSKNNNTHIVAVTNTPSIFEREIDIFKADNVTLSLGFHPQLIGDYGHEIDKLVDLLPNVKFIGEVGLDYQDNDENIRLKQKAIFQRILNESARYKDKILTVHSRKSSEEVVSMIGPNFTGVIILHWYSGSVSTLKKALSNGYFFSVNPSMTLSNSGKEIIKSLPLERILTETDGPFTRINGGVSFPDDVRLVIKYLSKLHGKSEDEIAKTVKNTFMKLLNF